MIVATSPEAAHRSESAQYIADLQCESVALLLAVTTELLVLGESRGSRPRRPTSAGHQRYPRGVVRQKPGRRRPVSLRSRTKAA